MADADMDGKHNKISSEDKQAEENKRKEERARRKAEMPYKEGTLALALADQRLIQSLNPFRRK
jgi:hypothetical protein